MRRTVTPLLVILIGLALSLTACKKQGATTSAPVQTVAAAPAPTATLAPARAEQSSPAAPSAATPATPQTENGKGRFDLDNVAVTSKPIPPFPYLAWPETVAKDSHDEEQYDFDRVYVIAGTELRPVEGRVNKRHYLLQSAKLSQLAAERNYESAMKEIGATPVNQVQPSDSAFQEAHKDFQLAINRDVDKLGIAYTAAKYTSYLLRTPTTNIWIVTSIDGRDVSIAAIEEKPLVQSVKPLSAATQ